jgi:GNAT superfamily N-acetyltransferase
MILLSVIRMVDSQFHESRCFFMQLEFNGYIINDDKSLLNLDVIKGLLAQSYWANRRQAERIETSIHHSLCYGVYQGSQQVGFARVVTDHATMYWLCDVIIDEAHRGQGLGKKLVESLTQSEELKDLMGLLGTRDAHELYEQYGFEADTERMMRRTPDFIRNRGKMGIDQ